MAEVTFRTSGSTGDPKVVVRDVQAMHADAAMLARTFGAAFSKAERFVSSVARDHFYGALWLGMLPVELGVPVADTTVTSVEDMETASAGGSFVFVTTPSFLERVLRHPETASLKGRVVDVVVSGGALRAETSEAAEAVIGVVPLEIYGSTEAGSIAWRRRSGSGLFQLFDGVEGFADPQGELVVKSRFAAESPLATHDVARFVSAREFELLGRTDRLAKVLESFVSLSAVERVLESHPFIVAARAETVDVDGVARVGAIAVLSEAGREALAHGTFAAVAAAIRRETVAATGSLAFPRRLRFVQEMPSDARGKTTAAAVRAALAANCREPVVLAWTATARSLDAEMAFPADGEWFSGHFPGFPILPGVAQLFFLRLFARRAFGAFPEAAIFKNIKFKRPIRPGKRVRLKLERSNQCDFSFEYSVGGAVASSGIVHAPPSR